MRKYRSYIPSITASALLCIILLLIWPYYRYYIDPDATAYLTIAKRYATGDIDKAVNGYWSPLSCWFTALFIKQGFEAFTAAIIVNTIGAMGYLHISQGLFLRFDMRRKMQWLLCGTLAIFLAYAVFKQSFADLWECFLLLYSLRIMLAERYARRPALWVMNGVVGAIAYFAKAYAFPFFILNTACCTLMLTHGWRKQEHIRWLKASIVPMVVMVLCSLPWVYMLHAKYGIWITSTAGGLNTSWYLVGHPYWADNIKHLLPPVYADSPYYWEDPYVSNGVTPHFWHSPKLFVLQILKVCYNMLKLVMAMSELSAFFLVMYVLALCMLCSKYLRRLYDRQLQVVCLSFLIFPAGFLLINYEARYLWYMLPLSMLLGAFALQFFYKKVAPKRSLTLIVATVFAGSYIAYPLYDMAKLANAGKREYIVAQQMKRDGIRGSFASNVVGKGAASMAMLAYHTGNQYYNMPYQVSVPELLPELRRYDIKYYFHAYGAYIEEFVLHDEQGRVLPVVAAYDGVRVVLVNPDK